MKNLMLFILIGVIGAFGLGFSLGRLSYNTPTPEQCLNVCVEQFEKYGC